MQLYNVSLIQADIDSNFTRKNKLGYEIAMNNNGSSYQRKLNT